MRTNGIWFKDAEGRTLILRGANLSGSSKVPFTPDGATYRKAGFFDHRDVSFVGRPFPLEEADEHLSRLRAWGMTFLRFLITWEAIEHEGPGRYDEAYLDYVYAVVKKAADYDISVFIDPHEDVWSRWTGGDGAPGWTLEAVGMDLTRLATTGAAISHQTYGDPFPRMIWPTNNAKLGSATMFTLFFAGNDFAPATKINGVSAQEFLQSHYINAVKQVAMRLKGLPNVAGYDSLNEPAAGYIGCKDLNSTLGLIRMGEMPTAYQGMLLASGYPQNVDVYQQGNPAPMGTALLNSEGSQLWLPGHECVWKQNGVWTDEGGSPRLLRPDYFAYHDGKPVSAANDYMKPFVKRFIEEIRSVDPEAILFIEGAPGGEHLNWGNDDPPQAVNATHWYDVVTLMTKTFDPDMVIDWSTMKAERGEGILVQATYDQLKHLKQVATDQMGGIPTLIGEFGLPFDLDEKRAYSDGNFSAHEQALDLYYDAMDANLLNCTIWNYTADNTNARGDMWNDEDLSIFSRDQQDSDDIHSGGRGLKAIVRPYARKIAGEPLQMRFDMATRIFELEFRHDPAVSAPTEIFVPDYQYSNGYTVELSDGSYEIDSAALTLRVRHDPDQAVHTVRIRPI